jgi:hypothetical protein
MGKFADFNIKNNTENTNVSQSNSGGYNVQNTQVINNRTINNHYTKQNSNGDGDAGAFMAGAVILTIGIGFVIWSFFTLSRNLFHFKNWCFILSCLLDNWNYSFSS